MFTKDMMQQVECPGHVQPDVARDWFLGRVQCLSNKYMFMVDDDACLEYHWRASLDQGAIRTLYFYMKDLPYAAFIYFAFRYYIWYWNEHDLAWTDRNPSAAVVAGLRFTYWMDSEFIQIYRPSD